MHGNHNSQRLKFIFEREMLVRLRRAYAKNFGCLVSGNFQKNTSKVEVLSNILLYKDIK